jgi:hypothetical protein
MKVLLTSTVFFVCTLAMGQDVSFINSISNTDRQSARVASDKIASLTTLNYRFYKAIEQASDSTYTIIYAPADVADIDLEAKNDWDECLFVDFKFEKEGDLKELRFSSIRGKYLDVFPAWKKYFKQKAHLEYTITDPSSREIADNQRGYHFVLQEGENQNIPRWSILNKS